jgi:acyl transferase domain-containing protein/NAD(P)H-dependent flavin oxidoreductase YrpB (nitropropane dioxygenase family)/NAD(P)-dependent dehydrogenase (short-subunit alcohol dehydrogenase family)
MSTAPESLVVVVLSASFDPAILASSCAQIHQTGRQVLCEATSEAEAEAALHAGADGLIAVGQEAGGWVGAGSAFIVLQELLARTDRPVWVRGGIGPRVAAGCVAAGAAGVVLEGAVLLARESPLAEDARGLIAAWDASETTLIEPEGGAGVRVYAPHRSPVLQRLREAARQGGKVWLRAVQVEVGWGQHQAWPAGHDASLAAWLAGKYLSVGGIVQAVEQGIARGLEDASRSRPLAADAPLARSHGCRLPILQGPMTRVSDLPSFAEAVAREGGLPFIALALLRRREAERLLDETARRLQGYPWGVGVLGFAPPALRLEQITALREVKPPFALIAGGRPDQAVELEYDGIATYLHVPSPELLEQYLRSGARRFVLEGRECGGHVGPRSSFVLWEQACRVLEQAIEGGIAAASVSLIFAGGIHDARSAAAVAALAGDLAARGVKIGILMGTAYLFTREAVATGAIVPRFQDEALRCGGTVLLETGPGHQVRVSKTPFVHTFAMERKRLISQGKPHEEVRETLERLNTGRLRIATKGVKRGPGPGAALVAASESEQEASGLYMLGQVAALRDCVVSMRDLHEDVTAGASDRIERSFAGLVRNPPAAASPAAVAIVGMAAVFPGARDVAEFWANSLRGVDAITEVPPDRWDWRLYFDADPKAPDKIYSRWGGFLPDIPFDPIQYGMPPSSLSSIEPAQLLALEVARAALLDAGYSERPFPRDRTAVVLGMGGGAAQVAMGYAFRSYLPMLDSVIPEGGKAALERCQGLLPEWTEDSFPGFLLNVTAGRIANRLDLGGPNYAVDAACGSSLAALNLAVRELKTGSADMVVLGGVDTVQNPFTYLAFSKTQAFSPRGRCRPFDSSADGIVISEGVAVVILKRLSDAERDGDRIYAVIQGVGSSSDGRSRGLTAPSYNGQVRALERAYAEAGIEPATIGYVEAHGTGTAVGDVVEIEALSKVYMSRASRPVGCVVGSVKSQIGHTKCAAGLAGLIHAALALHHRTYPPTIGIGTPCPQLDLESGPFRLNTEASPWLHPRTDFPRRAAVSAFGFGGTNFHAVLERYERDPVAVVSSSSPIGDWPAELLIWNAGDRPELLRDLDRLAEQLGSGCRPPLRDLSRTLARRHGSPRSGPVLAIVTASHEDLINKLNSARDELRDGRGELTDPTGPYFFAERPAFSGQQVAFVFPGQGSQRVGMLRDLAIVFDDVRCAFEEFDAALLALGREAVGPLIFPPPAFDEAAQRRQAETLRATEHAQPAIGAASVGMLRLLARCGIEPDVTAGHSYGELVALHAAGSLDTRGLAVLSEGRGRLLRAAGGAEPGAMAALASGPEIVTDLIGSENGVRIVNFNGPRQTVIAGAASEVETILQRAEARRIPGRLLPVACAFHTQLMQPAREPLARLAAGILTSAPDRPVFSNVDACAHPADPRRIAQRLGDHVTSPVRFGEMIAAMHDHGARVFVEVGPGGVLTPLVGSILGDRSHLAVACDLTSRPGLTSLLHALARLAVAGLRVRLEALAHGRASKLLDLDALPVGDGSSAPSPSTWLVNGSRARPIADAEPRRLGQANLSTSTEPRLAGKEPVEISILERSTPAHAGNEKSRGIADLIVPTATRDGSDRVLSAFQETMRTFLEVQRTTMMAYLSGRGPLLADPKARPEVVPAALETSPPSPARSSVKVPETCPKPENGSVAQGEHKQLPAQPVTCRDQISRKLLEIVQARTGYPLEVLRLELDLEAELGIDSIKRVEILGKLRDAFPQLATTVDPEGMDGLTTAKTLAAIVDRVERVIGRANIANPSSQPHAPKQPFESGSGNGKPHKPVRRLTLDTVESPLSGGEGGLMAGGTLVITDDGRGVAEACAGRLRDQGWRIALIGGESSRVDWTSPATVDAAIDRARSEGPITGIVHLLPLRPARAPALDGAAWADRLAGEVRGLFLLAKGAAMDLEHAARRGGACLIAATAMGGRFASTSKPTRDFFPGQGGVAGLIKTLGREWRAVRSRVVDLDLHDEAARLAERVLAEVLHDDPWFEVGYSGNRRIRLRTVQAPLEPENGNPALALEPGEPVLITGGARGITSLVAAELARRWRPTLLLLGTTPQPAPADDVEIDRLSSPAELKARLYERLCRHGQPISPADLERAYQRLRTTCEVRRNLERLRATGAQVEYVPVDVRDADRLAQVLSGWRHRFGEPVGLIHGAGLIRDKLIRDKSVESFDRVLGTKLDGALNLARLLRPEHLRFTVFFSSITGRFGNRGQLDYAAANEALNKLAIWLDRRWPGRVVAPIWGPWSGIGMVSDLERNLGAQGLGMIDPGAGVAALVSELLLGRKGDVEVILASDLGTLESPSHRLSGRMEAVR